ncbi:LysR family transcriptional regulator [Virgisporangium aliadipatigenens]|uniref:LysR family transcriptional regulator n=1 Tax=Virgisporangium aliadipatigenens TaxID=741659 RepID=A0A8J4DT58_9ACTN|nr:LysR family transcriptional regulator [Virgisporangium aliadipatigenens]GIJ48881.1 LysR family transcriptional regulator [Virgisporangium aliadipatigenens]
MQLDLNLLVVLNALLDEGSVMGAAERLHLSSPAVSRSLARLRKLTGDDILVRAGHTMVPTPYATAIRDDVRVLLRQVQDMLVPSRTLDPERLERTFTLQCHDGLATTLAPALLRRVQDEAPGVRLRILSENSVDTDELRRGHVDLELSQDRPELSEFRSETLGTDPIVVAMRSGHPCAEHLDLPSYASYPHVIVSRRGRLAGPIDEVLAAKGLRRHVVAAVTTGTMALHVASQNDMLVTTTELVSRPLVQAFNMISRPLPGSFPPAPINCIWHQLHDSDPAHAWLRGQVRAAVTEVVDQSESGTATLP